MNRRLPVVLVILFIVGVAFAQSRTNRSSKIPYGSNLKVGQFFQHDGVKLYYEVYGTGEPVLLVHGNSGSIADLSAQIEYFRKQYVLGWSDGGIEALLLGIRHPTKVKKIAAMAANLNPSEEALYPEILVLVKTMIANIPEAERNKPEVKRELKVTSMLLTEPNIDFKALEAITAPTLVLAADHDLIRDEHTLKIFQHIPNSQLVIFPNSTQAVPFDDPALFNGTVERFFRSRFVKKDRIQDAMKSVMKMRSH